MGLAGVLRAALARDGGQFFWPDEARFWTAVNAMGQFRQGAWHAGLVTLFSSADHLLFKVFSLLPSILFWRGDPRWVAALFFAGASTWVVWAVGDVSRAAGADDWEALLATGLAAATSCLFYYARHFFPYDLALGILLGALATSLRHPGRSLLVGAAVAAGFLTYNGYWYLGAVVLLLQAHRVRWRFRDLAALAGGLAGPVLLVLAMGYALRIDLVHSYLAFSGTVTHGDFGTAWRTIPEYFYVSEHGLALLWLAAVAGAALVLRPERRVTLWLVLSALLALLLVAPSDAVHLFTVSARHTRQLAPLLCLLTAAVLRAAWQRLGKFGAAGVAALAGLVILNAAFGFAAPLRQRFPDQFLDDTYGFRTAAARDLGPYTVVNDRFFDRPELVAPAADAGPVVFAEPHPYQFAPYLYDAYTAAWRADFQGRDLRMRVVRLPSGGPPITGYPRALRFTLVFPPPPALHEPLVVTGFPGRGDGLYVEYGEEHPDQVRFGHDHYGGGAVVGSPVTLDRAAPHVVTILMGSLLPPAGDPLYREHPGWLALKRATRVAVDGRTVLRETAAEYTDSPSQTITVGLNLIGLSTAAPVLTARIIRLESLAPDAVAP